MQSFRCEEEVLLSQGSHLHHDVLVRAFALRYETSQCSLRLLPLLSGNASKSMKVYCTFLDRHLPYVAY